MRVHVIKYQGFFFCSWYVSTSFSGSFIRRKKVFLPSLPWGGEMKDPGNEVGYVSLLCQSNYDSVYN